MAICPLDGPLHGPIAQNGPFWGEKCIFLARNQFVVDILQIFASIMTGHQKDNVFMLLMLLGKLLGVQRPVLAQKWPENRIFDDAPIYGIA